MKRWAFVVAGLYMLVLAALMAPAALLAFPMNKVGFEGIAEAYTSWPLWVLLVLMALSQFALLSVPVRIAGLRPVTRGSIWPTILAAGFMCGLLVVGAVLSIAAFVYQDDLPNGSLNYTSVVIVSAGVLSWAIWALAFHRASKACSPDVLVRKQGRALLKGSILELLIAVPTHIVARHRDNCCADAMTFFGMVFGFAVMLFAYGPAVFFLFAERWRQLHPETVDEPPHTAQT